MVILTPSTEDMRLYEVAVLLPVSLTEKERKEEEKSIEDIILEKGGKVLHKDSWGRRGLAYHIRHQSEASFIIYFCEWKPIHTLDIDRSIGLERSVLRHLVLKPPKGYEVVNYGEKYHEWLKEREEQSQESARRKEEQIKQKIVKRVGKGAIAVETIKPVEPAKAEEITEGLEKILSDNLGL